jgi:hypothetical protein
MVQVPDAVIVTTPEMSVHTALLPAVMENATGSPEVAVAAGVNVIPVVTVAGTVDVKATDWFAAAIEIVKDEEVMGS